MKRFGIASLALLFFSACTVVEVTPIPAGWLKTFQEGKQPLQRGSSAPGAFSYEFDFRKQEGLLYDPSKIEVTADGAYLKKQSSGPWEYPADTPSIETAGGMPFTAVDEWTEQLAPGGDGEVRYQISLDRGNWFYWAGKAWIEGVPHFSQASTSADLATHIGTFHEAIGNGRLYLRVFLFSPEGKKRTGLRSVRVQGVRKLDH
jgi:hypothetical protein